MRFPPQPLPSCSRQHKKIAPAYSADVPHEFISARASAGARGALCREYAEVSAHPMHPSVIQALQARKYMPRRLRETRLRQHGNMKDEKENSNMSIWMRGE